MIEISAYQKKKVGMVGHSRQDVLISAGFGVWYYPDVTSDDIFPISDFSAVIAFNQFIWELSLNSKFDFAEEPLNALPMSLDIQHYRLRMQTLL